MKYQGQPIQTVKNTDPDGFKVYEVLGITKEREEEIEKAVFRLMENCSTEAGFEIEKFWHGPDIDLQTPNELLLLGYMLQVVFNEMRKRKMPDGISGLLAFLKKVADKGEGIEIKFSTVKEEQQA
jgi:hypothetical protein